MTKNESFEALYSFCSSHADTMFREAEGCLNHPYLDPGGSYSKNLWDWDSFWAATALLGIAEKNKDSKLKDVTIKHARGALLNILEHQGKDGSLPIMMTYKCPDVFECVENQKNNMAKPVIGQFCKLLLKHGGIDSKEISPILEKLVRFFDCYKQRYLNQNTSLYVWANDIAIGVDDDPSSWGRPPFSSASIYLNCLIYSDLEAAADFASEGGNKELADKFRKEAEELKNKINKYCADKRDGLYYTVDVLCRQNLTANAHIPNLNINLKPFWDCIPLKVGCWVSFVPLFCKIANKDFAARMVNEHLVKKERFWTDFGIRTLAADERMYSPEAVRGNPSNWLGPIWIIANYVVWKGLVNYGFKREADELALNTKKLLADDYAKNGKIHEYYSPETGKGISGPGFMNWNLLVCLMED